MNNERPSPSGCDNPANGFSGNVTPPSVLLSVWSTVPDVGCKGLCADYCGPVCGSEVEDRLLAAAGVPVSDPADVLLGVLAGADAPSCSALVDGRCSVYDMRPTVCRLWGAVEDMPCPHGCEPEGGRLSSEEGRRVMARAMEVGQLRSRAVRRAKR